MMCFWAAPAGSVLFGSGEAGMQSDGSVPKHLF
jgi:hypothetical protein